MKNMPFIIQIVFAIFNFKYVQEQKGETVKMIASFKYFNTLCKSNEKCLASIMCLIYNILEYLATIGYHRLR